MVLMGNKSKVSFWRTQRHIASSEIEPDVSNISIFLQSYPEKKTAGFNRIFFSGQDFLCRLLTLFPPPKTKNAV